MTSKITKAQINRIIKGNGGVMKRTKGEIVEAIKFQAEKYGDESLDINTALFWVLGFEPGEARQTARQLIASLT